MIKSEAVRCPECLSVYSIPRAISEDLSLKECLVECWGCDKEFQLFRYPDFWVAEKAED